LRKADLIAFSSADFCTPSMEYGFGMVHPENNDFGLYGGFLNQVKE
jgi:hypothetical protein